MPRVIFQQPICCGCHVGIWHGDERGTFTGGVPSPADKNVDAAKLTAHPEKRLELTRGIELITGRKINKTKERSVGLCDACSQHVLSYLNFRARLLSSLNALNIFSEPHDAAPNPLDPETASEKSEILEPAHGKTGRTDQPIEEASLDGIDDDDDDNHDVDRKTPISRSFSEDIINVDENSTPLNLDASPSFNSERDLDERTTDVKVQIDRTNENQSDSDDSSNDDGSGRFSAREVVSKIEETDIESEIDVCSGEDDEVLELDSRSRRDETVEIGSTSSESDIEVCDYEPTGKRVKCYGALSPPLLY